jgi:hypothetical protein
MTKEEYKKFKSQHELLGQLESERIQKIHLSKESIKRELEFLEEIHTILSKSGMLQKTIEDRLQNKIKIRKILNNAFNRI